MKSRFVLLSAIFCGLVLLSLTLFSAARSGQAATCQTQADGEWHSPATWSCDGGITVPGAMDDATVNHQVLIDQDASVRNITLTGILTGTGNLNVSGDWLITEEGIFTPGVYTVTLDGDMPQRIIGETIFYNLIVDNPTFVETDDVLTVLNLFHIQRGEFTNNALFDVGTVMLDDGDFVAGEVISVSGDWAINGYFHPSEREVVFDGRDEDQFIRGGPLDFSHVIIANAAISGAVVLEDVVEVAEGITVNQGAMLDVGNDNLSFASENATFNNQGMVRQRTPVVGSPTFPAYITFTTFQEGSFLGGSISTTSDLGEVAFSLQSNAASCTTNEMDPHALRCFEITSTITEGISATVRLYVRTDELNGIAPADLRVYRFDDRYGWEKLPNLVTGTISVGYAFAQGDTFGFSSFILGPPYPGPTSLGMITVDGGPRPSPFTGGLSMGPILLLALGVGFTAAAGTALLHRRRG